MEKYEKEKRVQNQPPQPRKKKPVPVEQDPGIRSQEEMKDRPVYENEKKEKKDRLQTPVWREGASEENLEEQVRNPDEGRGRRAA